MKKHKCEAEVYEDGIKPIGTVSTKFFYLVDCSINKDGKLMLYAAEDSHHSMEYEVKYCPFCGELSPKYKQTCFKCKKSSDAQYQFTSYHYDSKEIVLCGVCRKELDEAIEVNRNKSIREFLNGVTPLIEPKELWNYMCRIDNPECKVTK